VDEQLRAFLHDLVSAATGPGTADRLHTALDEIGKIAEAVAPVVEAVVKAAPLI
jgi:hypothetical protein